jgi:hypothetical protein
MGYSIKDIGCLMMAANLSIGLSDDKEKTHRKEVTNCHLAHEYLYLIEH